MVSYQKSVKTAAFITCYYEPRVTPLVSDFGMRMVTVTCLVQVGNGIELEAVGLQFEPYRWRPCGVTWDSSRTVVVIKLRRTSALKSIAHRYCSRRQAATAAGGRIGPGFVSPEGELIARQTKT